MDSLENIVKNNSFLASKLRSMTAKSRQQAQIEKAQRLGLVKPAPRATKDTVKTNK